MSGTTVTPGSHVNSVAQMDAMAPGAVLVDQAGWKATKQLDGSWIYLDVTRNPEYSWAAETALVRFGPYTVQETP